MAKTKPKTTNGSAKPTEGEVTAKHNTAARAAIINDVIREVVALEAERKSIGEHIREIKQTKIKGDLGMKIGDFNAALRLYQLEGDDRAEFFDTLRETFQALGVGEQLDFLSGNVELANQPDHEVTEPEAADAA